MIFQRAAAVFDRQEIPFSHSCFLNSYTWAKTSIDELVSFSGIVSNVFKSKLTQLESWLISSEIKKNYPQKLDTVDGSGNPNQLTSWGW